MIKHLEKSSETHEAFCDLIGKEVTFANEVINHTGGIMHHKGEKAYISDVEYTPGFWSNSTERYIEPRINTFQINNVRGSWRPQTFVVFDSTKQQ